jgi:hypothetical protein
LISNTVQQAQEVLEKIQVAGKEKPKPTAEAKHGH